MTLSFVTGHRKQQIQLYRRQTNTVFFFQVYSYNLRSTYNNIDAWSSSQVLYESLGRSGNAGVRAEDQHSLVVPERRYPPARHDSFPLRPS